MEPFAKRPERSVLLFDFDGVISAIVADPAAARPRPGAVEALTGLAGDYLKVGVISGRPVSFLADALPLGLFLSGLYGMEEMVDGEVHTRREFTAWHDVMAAALTDVRTAVSAGGPLSAVEVEDKGLSATLHYRGRPELADVVPRLAESVADAHGIDTRPAKMSVELHPPVPTDKGDVVRRVVSELSGVESVLYVGDDVGDLPAFDAVASLRARSIHAVSVAVATDELDHAVRDAADLVIADADVVDLLCLLRPGR